MKIFDPSNIEQMLRGWLIHSRKARERHNLAARRCDRLRLLLGGTAAVVSAIVGTSVFVALEKGAPNIAITLGVAMLSIASAILTSLSTFLNLAEHAEKHRSAGVGYKKVIRELERILSEPVDNLTNSDTVVVNIQRQLDELEERAPVVSEKFYARVEAEWEARGAEIVTEASELYQPKVKS